MQIARDWNTKDEASGFTGYDLRFQIRDEYLVGHRVQTIGSGVHQEYWIPAAFWTNPTAISKVRSRQSLVNGISRASVSSFKERRGL